MRRFRRHGFFRLLGFLRLAQGVGRCLGFVVGHPFGYGDAEMPAELVRDVLVNRAGVGFLLADTQVREHIEDFVGLDLEFPGQLVDSDLSHICTELPHARYCLNAHRGQNRDSHQLQSESFIVADSSAADASFSGSGTCSVSPSASIT